MQRQENFSRVLYNEGGASVNSANLIYDEIYRNATHKFKYSHNPKYTYYNALLNMKQKLSQKLTPVYNNMFKNHPPPQRAYSYHESPPSRKKQIPVYHVQKINKMKFKIYKQGVQTQFIEKLPITDLSFQIKMKKDFEENSQNHNKPRLEDIISQYRRLNIQQRTKTRSEGQRKYSFGDQFKIPLMRHTVSRFPHPKSYRK